MEPLTTVEEVGKGLDLERDTAIDGIILTAIEDLSDDARHYGLPGWETPEFAPVQVCRLVRRAAIAYMKRFEGLVQSRAGDETLVWSDLRENAGTPFFTESQIAQLRSYQGKSSISTAPVSAWGTNLKNSRETTGYVPTDSSPFPLFASEDGPW